MEQVGQVVGEGLPLLAGKARGLHLLLQAISRLMDVPGDGSRRTFLHDGGFSMAQPLENHEHDGGAHGAGQAVEGVEQARVSGAQLGGFGGVVGCIDLQRSGDPGVSDGLFSPTFAVTPRVEAPIDGHSVDPGEKVRATFKAGELLVGLEKYLLGDVLSFALIAGKVQSES